MFRLIVLCIALAWSMAPAFAQEYPPRPAGPVYDGADLIPPSEEAALDQRLRDYNAQTGRAIVVATVPSLEGNDVDLYSRGLAEEWGIGGAETEEGVLLFVARDDRKMAIKTARGVQGRLTDISSGRIIRETLRPAFREGDFAGGIDAAVDRIIERLDLEPAQAEAIAEAEAAAEQERQSEGGFPIGALVWLAFIGFFFIAPMFGGGRRRRYRRGGMGGVVGDIILWEAGKAIARGISDSDDWGGGGFGGGGFGGGGGGGFGGFGGGGGGFNGGGASGGW